MLAIREVSRVISTSSLVIVLFCFIVSCGGGGGGGDGGGDGTPPPSGPTAPPSTAALKVNAGDSRATFANMRAAFNNFGQGVVVWEETTGMNNRVLWAYFDGAVMHPEAELAPYSYQPSVATNGTEFMLVWNTGRLYSAPCSSSGVLGTPVVISGWDAQYSDIASNGSGYAATWRGYESGLGQYRTYVNIYSASSWTSANRIDDINGHSNQPRIVSNGAGYAVAWQKYDGASTYNIYATVSSGGTSTATWQAASLLEDLSGYSSTPSIASDGNGYAVAWAQDDGSGAYSVYANIYGAGAWSSAGTSIENGPDSTAGGNTQIASNGLGYAVAWSQYDGSTYSAYANVYSGGTWTTAALLETSPHSALQVAIASNGTGYAVAWQQDNGLDKDINASLYSAGSWSAPVLLDAGASSAQQPLAVRFPTGYAVAWYQDDASGNPNMYGTIYAGGVWSAANIPLVQGAWKGTSFIPKMATNRSGVSLAVWPEYHKGSYRIMGSINASGAWGLPFLIDSNTANDVDVATNGASFMVLWYSTTQGAPLAVTCSSDGVLGVPEKVAPATYSYAYYPSLASNGSGYAAAWSQWDYSGVAQSNIYANVYSSGTWSKDGGGIPTPWTIENASNYAYYPNVASNGSGYAATWSQYDGVAYSVYANLFTSGTWSTGGTLLETSTGHAASPSIASNGSGYAVSWYQEDGIAYSIYANIYSSGTWSTGGTLLGNGPGYAYEPRIASNGSGYAVAWYQYEGGVYNIYANIYSSGTWSTGGTPIENSSNGAYGPSIASNGSGYAVAWYQYEGVVFNIYANVYSSGTWSTGGTLLETNSGDADSVTIVSNGNKYSAIWWQQDPADLMVYDIWAKLGF